MNKDKDQNKLLIAFVLVLGMMIVEFLAGFIAKSVALVSDATHMLVDAFALGCAFFAAKLVNKNRRAEIYAALINGFILTLMAIFIFKSSFNRFFHPVEIRYKLMIIVAMAGLIINVVQFLILKKGDLKNINLKGAFLHVISDGISSCGVIIGGIIIGLTGWYKIDSILGFVIALLIFRYGIRLVRDSLKLLKTKK